MVNKTEWQQPLRELLTSLKDQAPLRCGQVLVIGTSTSEVLGEHIGKAGSEEVAEALFDVFQEFREETGVRLAFQGCEHINRALTVERETADAYGLEAVSVVPHPRAGGSMSSYAYKHMSEPVVIESVKADAGIDIGSTLIGMHLKPVAVPVRGPKKQIGSAYVTMAKTRPKLIGGERARYE
ncbi:TIGR01440 family protein [Marinococcus halophilus]|uniref:UPF0340 protein MHA01_21900 n=1 Tax=Marinococcus halophilus TaxID=1371 RepID=A0A510Y7E2_MARHA|nr:TIGR01440 family protein [Marinococcus halophilus]OZT81846.1 TIGR01440 family protein [Marinococcus halophilus]GEK59285.1 UPF0340 protein YwlG [Marinococcus halophilus]